MKKIAVLISGSGSNLYNLATKVKKDLSTKCKIELVVSNVPDVKGLEIAKEFAIPSVVLINNSAKISVVSKTAEGYNNFASLKLKAEDAFLKIKPYIQEEGYSLFELMSEAVSNIKSISPFPEEDFKENLLTDLFFEKISAGKGEVSESEEAEMLTRIDDLLYDLIEEVKVLSGLFLEIKQNPKLLNFFARERYDATLSKALEENKIDYIFLAGFMHILSPAFVEKWKGRIFNIHPSLLPSFKGAKAVKEALDYGVKVTGVTVHFVGTGVDDGKIIDQTPVAVLEKDTLESLHARIKEAEKTLYPKVLEDLIEGKINITL